jgi:hypothetical protein
MYLWTKYVRIAAHIELTNEIHITIESISFKISYDGLASELFLMLYTTEHSEMNNVDISVLSIYLSILLH